MSKGNAGHASLPFGPAPSAADVGDRAAAAMGASGNDPSINTKELMVAEDVKQAKARVLYKNGYTLPTGAATLLANAQRREYNHRRTLSRNIVAAAGQARPAAACAHHIVALKDGEAARSRTLLFRMGIGINDADNGVFLPSGQTGIAGHPSAAHHTSYHSPEYHYEVFVRLRRGSDEAGGRHELKDMKGDLLAGRMQLQ